MQIPIISGIYSDEASDFRTLYPRNLIPVPKPQGISNGYLRPADGIVGTISNAPGVSNAGINWNGVCFRVMGSKLVSISSNNFLTEIFDFGTNLRATMDYSFDYLSISIGNRMFLYDGSTVEQIDDPDLLSVVDHIWVDGYFMTTDGEYIVVTELNDPFSVNPLKYGSSEADPDPILALLKLRNEPHALNRYTIEVFDNVGGEGFPFQRIDGAQIQKGVVGTYACCVFINSIAFVGGGRNESIAVWLANSGNTVKISTREIDQILAEYNDYELSNIVVENRLDKGHQHLFIHLPNQSLVYDAAASQVLKQPVWFILSSGPGYSVYRMRDLVWCYGKWLVGDTDLPQTGELTTDVATHWGNLIEWEFNTSIIYNDRNGAIFHELELVCLSGRVDNVNLTPTISTEYSFDGENWSIPRYISAGKRGERNKRLVWLSQGHMKHWRIQKFKGTSVSRLSMARLEARIEPLAA